MLFLGSFFPRDEPIVSNPAQGEFTRLLSDLHAGKESVEEALLPLVYGELRALARHYMRKERSGHTLQTTALVHEAFIRLSGVKAESWENKKHYLRLAARAMRRVLIDHARRKKSLKKGKRGWLETIENAAVFEREPSIDLIALDDALKHLCALDEDLGKVVELRFFGGLTIEETANVLGVSPRTVVYNWRLAKAWLKEKMEQ